MPSVRGRSLPRTLASCLAMGLAASLAVSLGGCVSAFSDEALRGVDRRLTVGELRSAPAGTYVHARVVLGGEILEARPKVGETELEILARRLRSDDSPERSDRSDGRFLVRSRTFLDPAVFATGRRVTVLGTVAGEEERKLGDLPYRYPLVDSLEIRLWPREAAMAPYPPHYYDPYGPYWGWGLYWSPYRGWSPWPPPW